MFLFDTDILSELLKPRPSTTLLNRLVHVPRTAQFTSSVSLGEILYGTYLLGPRGIAKRSQIEEDVIPMLTIVAFDEAAARVYAELRAESERAGSPIGDRDTQIGATALAHSLTVVTGNVRHFERIPGLRVGNWLT